MRSEVPGFPMGAVRDPFLRPKEKTGRTMPEWFALVEAHWEGPAAGPRPVCERVLHLAPGLADDREKSQKTSVSLRRGLAQLTGASARGACRVR